MRRYDAFDGVGARLSRIFGETALDRIDGKILNLYQHDTRCIAESIGAEVGLSAAAVQRRFKRLRAEDARRWFEPNVHVMRHDTHVALERVKVGLSLPVDAGAPHA
jgi:hypothetical protein